jgi:UDP-glucose:(heptosyl)LPS alpha-1,3-glucosyltransferase
MKIAFCLLNYFPFGGLQRDFLRIAKECVRRGHEVHVYTMRWDGPAEPDFHLHLIKVSGVTNHARARSFARQAGKATAKGDYALVVGFNKMPHLDLYYAADVCYQARIKAERSCWYRLLPRYHTYQALEAAVFAPTAKTEILLISAVQQQAYASCYHTEANRFHLLPPGISRDRLAPANAAEMRAAQRRELKLDENDLMLLMVGSGYQTKGLDRAIAGLAALPDALRQRCHLYVVGKGDAAPFLRQARQLGVDHHVHIIGASSDVPSFLLAADLLLHPSYHENTGTALLEALAAGLPVLTTAVCGYAHYITDANAGKVLPAKFCQQTWNANLENMLSFAELKQLGQNGLTFAASADIYDMPQRAADLIEQRARQRDLS